jgi:hypothetical protein
VLFLQPLELVEETVVLGVGDLRIVEHVVAIEVVVDRCAQLGYALFDVSGRFRRAGCHCPDRIGGI